MSLSVADWHQRYLEQARWTQGLRHYLYERLGLGIALGTASSQETGGRILEVGCGTGVLLAEIDARIANYAHCNLIGIDTDLETLAFASSQVGSACLLQADAHTLPFRNGYFDIAYCHFLLLWTADPLQVLQEMRRMVRPGGAVLVMAEPDYGGRIDFPEQLGDLGAWQEKALANQGANPHMGRNLASLFSRAGFQAFEFGVLGGQWSVPAPNSAQEIEWNVLRNDLGNLTTEPQINQLLRLDQESWRTGERVLYVPTFYAWGRKQED